VWQGVFHPSAVQGVRVELLAGILYLGHLYAWESGQFRPLIFLSPVWYDAVWCGVSSDPAVYPIANKSVLYSMPPAGKLSVGDSVPAATKLCTKRIVTVTIKYVIYGKKSLILTLTLKTYLLSNLEKMLKKLSSKRDLNPGPLGVQASTLPTQPRRHCWQ